MAELLKLKYLLKVGVENLRSDQKTEWNLVLKIALMVQSVYKQVWICNLGCNHLE